METTDKCLAPLSLMELNTLTISSYLLTDWYDDLWLCLEYFLAFGTHYHILEIYTMPACRVGGNPARRCQTLFTGTKNNSFLLT